MQRKENISKIDFSPPFIDESIIAEVIDTLQSG
jgi:hypothetical protein